MTQITASLVKNLRDQTGAGMMDAKKALIASDGDTQGAIDWLRAKGLSKAAEKASRISADGLVAVAVSADGKTGAMVELNAETDFVARNETFQTALRQFAEIALETDGTVEALAGAPSPDGDGSVQDMITRLVASIRENISLRRTAKLEAGEGVVASYVHNKEADGMGKLGVLVALEGGSDIGEIGKKIAMHIAATSPLAATTEELNADVVAREREVLVKQARESGKPEKVIEKMIEGRMRKFYKESVLVEQQFVMDTDQTVGQVLTSAKAVLKGFRAFKLGEGIAKAEDNFADEVASLSKTS